MAVQAKGNDNMHASEATILLGTVPCPIPTGGKTEEPRATHVAAAGRGAGMINQEGVDMNDRRKRLRLLTHASREIVGLGYSVEPAGHTAEEGQDRVNWPVWQPVGKAQKMLTPVEKEGLGTGSSCAASSLVTDGKQGSGQRSEVVIRKGKKPEPRWCPTGLTKTQ
jgi:hypothetical protein